MARLIWTILLVFGCAHTNIKTSEMGLEPKRVVVSECTTPIILMPADYPFSKMDVHNLNIAKDRCKKLYSNSPCLRSFSVVSYQNYEVTCGHND